MTVGVWTYIVAAFTGEPTGSKGGTNFLRKFCSATTNVKTQFLSIIFLTHCFRVLSNN